MKIKVETAEVEALEKAMRAFPGKAGEAINNELKENGASILRKEINRLMPVSGRKWKGKLTGARKSKKSLKSSVWDMTLVVFTSTPYGYLYFPNDGTNTKRHAGERYFFEGALANKEAVIIHRCVQRLTDEIQK